VSVSTSTAAGAGAAASAGLSILMALTMLSGDTISSSFCIAMVAISRLGASPVSVTTLPRTWAPSPLTPRFIAFISETASSTLFSKDFPNLSNRPMRLSFVVRFRHRTRVHDGGGTISGPDILAEPISRPRPRPAQRGW